MPPLRVTCQGCGRTLLLEEVFRGAYCRCRHCRTLMHIEKKPQPAIRGVAVARPDSPLSRGPQRSPAGKPAADLPAWWIALSEKATRVAHRVSSPGVVITAVSLIAFGLSGFAWYATAPRPAEAPPYLLVAEGTRADEGPWLSAEAAATKAMREGDPLAAYFGVAISNGVTGYVVDGDASMQGYINKVALVTNAVNEAYAFGDKKFGIVVAKDRDQDGQTLLEVAEPRTDLAQARTVLTSGLATGRTDLVKALATTVQWDADQIFLVLAKRLDAQEIELLAEKAGETGAVVNVIGLGEAARQREELAPIAARTGGQFRQISDRMLEDWAARVEQAREAAAEQTVATP